MIYTVVHIIPWVLLNFKGTMSETFKQNKVNKLEGTCWPMCLPPSIERGCRATPPGGQVIA